MPDLKFHVQRLESLRTGRANFDSQWSEAAERLIPAHAGSFNRGGAGIAMSQGRKGTEKMYDATAALALQRFTAVIESLATPQSAQWHRLIPTNPELRKNRQVRQFMDEVTRLLFRYRYRPKANFVGQSQRNYMSYGAYGNGILFVDTDTESDVPGPRYRNLHLGETYFAENHQGVVDTMYRVMQMKPAQIVGMFGDAAPERIKEAVGKGGQADQFHEVIHAVYPRKEFDPERRDGKGMPFASVYFMQNPEAVLRESGYRSFPAPVARYTQFTNETYGRGPAQIVLPSIKVLNEQKKTVLKQGHRVVDPVLLAHDDGVVGTFSMRPGAINPGGVNSQGRPLIQPLPTGNVLAGKDMMDDERAVINDAFLITLFQILVQDKSRMTATEVIERTREKGMLIAPTTGRLQAEFLGPMIEREIDILEQGGLLPPVPPVLLEAGAGFEIEYDAPMSRMARAENASGFMRSLDTALAFFQATQDPSILDWFEFDEAMPAILDIHGSPVQWTRDPAAVQELRKARAAQQQQQQLMEQAPALASAAKTVTEMGG